MDSRFPGNDDKGSYGTGRSNARTAPLRGPIVLLFILAYLGGILTILSPCILPVLPFVFARSDRPFLRSGLPLLAGMAITFAGVATLATLGGSWAVHDTQWGRTAAMVLLALFGLTLLLPQLA